MKVKVLKQFVMGPGKYLEEQIIEFPYDTAKRLEGEGLIAILPDEIKKPDNTEAHGNMVNEKKKKEDNKKKSSKKRK